MYYDFWQAFTRHQLSLSTAVLVAFGCKSESGATSGVADEVSINVRENFSDCRSTVLELCDLLTS